MTKKGPEIRVVGNVSEKEKEVAKEEIKRAFFDHFGSLSQEAQNELRKFECPKKEEEIAIIEFANQLVSQLMQEAGIKPYNIPLENIHIVPSDLYKKIVSASDEKVGTVFYTKQGIVLNSESVRGNLVFFARTVFHEILHLTGHLSIRAEKEGETLTLSLYRKGVTVASLQKGINYHEHFTGLHEAIVTETEKRWAEKILECPALSKERDWLISKEAKEMKKRLAEEKGISEEEILWIGKGKGDWALTPYSSQREVLNYVCNQIQEQFPERFKNSEDVFKLFLRAHFTGRLLEIARLVEETFGKGSFRLLGDMKSNNESGVLCLEALKKARTRKLKEKSILSS